MLAPREYFDGNSELHLQHATWANDKNLDAAIGKTINNLSPSTIIDLGCGDGRVLQLFDSVSYKIALDISWGMLDKIKDDSIKKINGDIHNIPLQSGHIDCAICRQVLHYCDLKNALKEIHRILISNGFALIVQMTDYNQVPDSWYNEWASFKGIENRRHLSLSEIIEESSNAGFTVAKTEFYELSLVSQWDDLYKKYGLKESNEQEKLYSFFSLSPQEIKSVMNIEITDDYLKLNRLFSLILLTKTS